MPALLPERGDRSETLSARLVNIFEIPRDQAAQGKDRQADGRRKGGKIFPAKRLGLGVCSRGIDWRQKHEVGAEKFGMTELFQVMA